MEKNRCTYRGVALTKNAKNVALIQVPHNIKKNSEESCTYRRNCTYRGLHLSRFDCTNKLMKRFHWLMDLMMLTWTKNLTNWKKIFSKLRSKYKDTGGTLTRLNNLIHLQWSKPTTMIKTEEARLTTESQKD